MTATQRAITRTIVQARRHRGHRPFQEAGVDLPSAEFAR
jgi:hypothetical protein